MTETTNITSGAIAVLLWGNKKQTDNYLIRVQPSSSPSTERDQREITNRSRTKHKIEGEIPERDGTSYVVSSFWGATEVQITHERKGTLSDAFCPAQI